MKSAISEIEKKEIEEIVSKLFLLSRTDRRLILSNINILKIRHDLENEGKDSA